MDEHEQGTRADAAYEPPEATEVETGLGPAETAAGTGTVVGGSGGPPRIVGVEDSQRWH